MSDLPRGWETATLSALIGQDGVFSDGDWIESKDQDPNGSTRLLQLADVGDGKFLDKSARFINDATFEQLRCTEVAEGDILIARMPDPLGRACLAPELPQRCITVVDVAIVRPGQQSVNPKWLMHCLNAPEIRERIRLQASGSTRQRIARGKLAEMLFPVPPKAEQKRIADKIDAVLAQVDACRDRLARVPAILKRFRQAVLDSAMGGELTADWREGSSSMDETTVFLPGAMIERAKWRREGLPKCWQWKSLGEAFRDETDSNRKLPQSNYAEAGAIPVVDQGASLIGGYTERADLISVAPLPAIVFGDHTRCVKYIDFNFVQGADGVKVLSPIKDTIAPRFAYFALLACELPDKGYSRHMKFLKASHFPCPPMAEQTEIVRRVETLFAFADRLETRYTAARAQVEKLTPSLLAKAFRGELVPQDPNDEPADVLLERIRSTHLSIPTKSRGRNRIDKSVVL